MSDYDAFGRKKDEAGLDDLGWGSTGETETTASDQPTVSATTQDPGFHSGTDVPVAPPPRRVRSPRRPLVMLVQLAVLGGIAFSIYLAVDAGQEAADTVRDTFNQIDDFNGSGGGGGGGGSDDGSDTVPDQVGARKHFTPGGLETSIRILKRELPGKPTYFVIRRDRIDVQVLNGNDVTHASLYADAEAPDVSTTTTGSGGPNPMNWEEIIYTAPARLIKAANQRLGQSEADVDYLIPQSFSGQIQWYVYYKGGNPIAAGDSRGRYVRRIS